MNRFCRRARWTVPAFALVASPAAAQDPPREVRPEETEIWEPVPPVVTVPQSSAPAVVPSDAIVLFAGTSLDEWVNARDGSPAGWFVADGVMTVNKAAGDIRTKRSFRDFQIHVEWRVPEGITGEGQRLYHLLWYASQRAVLCIAPHVGKEQTFVLLDESFGLALAAFALLVFWKVPPWLVVILSAVAGWGLDVARSVGAV